jgi:serine/threonine protein kinase
MTTELQFEYDISPEAENLVRRLLKRDPLKRLTIPEILSHPWVSGEEETEMEPVEEEDSRFKLPDLVDMIHDDKPFSDDDKPNCDVNLENLYHHMGD